MPVEPLNIDVKTRDDASAKFKALKQEFNALRDAFKGMVAAGQQNTAMFQQVTARLQVLNPQIKNAEREIRGLTNGLKRSGAQLLEMGENLTVVAAGIYAVLAPMKNWLSQNLRLGAELEVLQANFEGTIQDLEHFRIATARTVTDANLIKLSNQASDLGVSLKDQKILFSLAENAADKYGGTVEENFQKVLFATEGNIKGLKMVGIEKEKYEEFIKKEVKAIGDELNVRELTIDKLDAESQKRIRTNAVIQLSGETLQSATSKTKDNKDKIDALSVALTNLNTKIGMGMVKTLAGEFDKLGNAIKSTGIKGDKLPIGDALETLGKTLPRILLPMTNLGSAVEFLAKAFTNFKKTLTDSNTALSYLFNALKNSIPTPALDAIKLAAQLAKNELLALAKLLGLIGAEGTSRMTGVTGIEEPGSERAGKWTKPTITDTQQSKANKEKEKELNLLAIEQKNLADLQEQLSANLGIIGAELEIKKKIEEVTDRIFFLETGITKAIAQRIEILQATALRQSRRAERIGLGFGEATIGEKGLEEQARITEMQQQAADLQLQAFEQSLSIAQSIAGYFGQGASAVVNAFMQAYSLVQSIVALIKTIQTISSLLSLIPGGGAIGAIAGRAHGGSVMAGTPYIVGERGAELFVPDRSGYVLANNIASTLAGMKSGGDLYLTLAGELSERGAVRVWTKGYSGGKVHFAKKGKTV